MTLPHLIRALKAFLPASSRWSLLSEDLTLLYHNPIFPMDRYDAHHVLGELLPYLEILSGDILLVKGKPLLAHSGEAALVMIFPKSVLGQNLFFVERLTLDFFPQTDHSLPPVYLSRNFADDGNLLGELQDLMDPSSLKELTRSFHHLLWIQLKVLNLFSDNTFSKIRKTEISRFLKLHRDFLKPYLGTLIEQDLHYERSWSAQNKIALSVTKKSHGLHFDFSKSTWPKEWGQVGELLEALIPVVMRKHLYPELPGSHAEHDFFSVTVPSGELQESYARSPLVPLLVVPLLCDFLSAAFTGLQPDTEAVPSAAGPLFLTLDFGAQGKFRHLLFGGSGATNFSHGEAASNPWLPGLETASVHQLKNYPLEPVNLGLHRNSGGGGFLKGGDGVEWTLKLKAPAQLSVYSFQGVWPARGSAPSQDGRKAQILVSSDGSPAKDLLGKKIRVEGELNEGATLVLRTAGGAGWSPPDIRVLPPT